MRGGGGGTLLLLAFAFVQGFVPPAPPGRARSSLPMTKAVSSSADVENCGHFYGFGDPSHEPSILQRITLQREEDVANARKVVSEATLRERARELDRELGGPLNLFSRIEEEAPEMAVAAEFKRASPSKGDIAPDLVAGEQAVKYAGAGAAVLSVLTEPKWFKGTLDDMLDVRRATQALEQSSGKSRPAVLRKDFVIDEYMILEARAHGADTVLLIVAILGVDRLQQLMSSCREEGMEPLVEVHTDREMEIALEAGARVIGVNNRNLHTFELDLGTTERIAKVAARMGFSWGDKGDIQLAALSGIASPADVQRFRDAEVKMVLVGETLMRAADPGAAISTLLGREASGSVGQVVKVCGVTSAEDALAAVKSGANLIGIIFAPKSARKVSEGQAREIVEAVRAFGERKEPKNLSPPSSGEMTPTRWFSEWANILSEGCRRTPLVVGVFQNQPLEEVRRTAIEVGLDLVQLHGDEGMEACSQCGVPAIRVLHVPGEAEASTAQERANLMLKKELVAGHAAAVLLDTTVKGAQGGTGVQFDPQVAKLIAEEGIPVIVAGGIKPANVQEVLRQSSAWGVDCSSGVEKSPGVKDHQAVKQYIRNVKGFSAAAAAASSTS